MSSYLIFSKPGKNFKPIKRLFGGKLTLFANNPTEFLISNLNLFIYEPGLLKKLKKCKM
jgi:hypothetical protein